MMMMGSSKASVSLSLILLLQCASALLTGNERQFGVLPNDSAASVVFLRHGESLFNQINRFAGWADPPLTARGELEALAVSRLLASDSVFAGHFDRIRCFPINSI